MLLSQDFIKPLDTCAFDSPQLLDGTAKWSGLAEAHVVHLAYDLQAGFRIQRQTCLVQESVGACAAWLTRGVKANSCFADPYQETADACCQGDGRMGNPGTGFQHQAGETTHGDMHAHTRAIHGHECTVENIQLSLLDKKD